MTILLQMTLYGATFQPYMIGKKLLILHKLKKHLIYA